MFLPGFKVNTRLTLGKLKVLSKRPLLQYTGYVHFQLHIVELSSVLNLKSVFLFLGFSRLIWEWVQIYHCIFLDNKGGRKKVLKKNIFKRKWRQSLTRGQFDKLVCTLCQTVCALCTTFEKLFTGIKVQPKAQNISLGRKTVN